MRLKLLWVASFWWIMSVDCFSLTPKPLTTRLSFGTTSSSSYFPLQSTASDVLESDDDSDKIGSTDDSKASKRQMLRFAVPALGIYLTNPLLSNIDNAFVGRTVGTTGLAALSPATICTDQMIYLFSFLGRATTGIVARVYFGSRQGDTEGAREAAAARTFSIRLLVGYD